MQILFKESKQFVRAPKIFPEQTHIEKGKVEPKLLEYVLKNSEKGNPIDVLNKIDEFCQTAWMMNVGRQKADIIRQMGFNQKTQKILEIGGYCGYSALVFANEIKNKEKGQVYTIEINKDYAQIAKKIHQHAGLSHKIHTHIGTVESSQQFLKSKSPFDLIFIDHLKSLYLPDLKLLQQYGAIQKGTVVVGDNIIRPGAPQYLAYFQKSHDYDSTLYHSFVEYSNDADAVLISTKL